VNAILDDSSNESFLNEEVAGALGLKEPRQRVKVHVLNNSVETFQTMSLTIEIESVNGQLIKEIEVKMCPCSVTGSYKVEDWEKSQQKWPHLVECDFPFAANDGLVDLLIGMDNADLHTLLLMSVERRANCSLVWVPSGGLVMGLQKVEWSPEQEYIIRIISNKGTGCCCELDQALKRFWEVESYGTELNDKIVCTEEEKLALEKVSSSISYNNGRYGEELEEEHICCKGVSEDY